MRRFYLYMYIYIYISICNINIFKFIYISAYLYLCICIIIKQPQSSLLWGSCSFSAAVQSAAEMMDSFGVMIQPCQRWFFTCGVTPCRWSLVILLCIYFVSVVFSGDVDGHTSRTPFWKGPIVTLWPFSMELMQL